MPELPVVLVVTAACEEVLKDTELLVFVIVQNVLVVGLWVGRSFCYIESLRLT